MNKINNKVLILVVVALGAIVLGKKFIGNNNERNLKEVLVAVDTARVTKIVISPKLGNQEYSFQNLEGKWEVSSGAINDEADLGMVKAMLGSMVSMKPERLVAVSPDKWQQYEVDDSLGIKVKAYSKDELLSEFIVGKFNFQQTTRAMSTFVRLAGDDQVYSVKGFLSSNFNQPFNGFRDKTFLSLNKDDIARIEYSYPGDSSFVLTKNGDWYINGISTDSVLTDTYLKGLENITKREFVDDFDGNGLESLYTMKVDLNNSEPIVVNCYVNGEEKYVLHSSLNEDAFFEKGSLDLFKKLFISPKALLEPRE